MPRPSQRSTHLRKVMRKTPGGVVKKVFLKRKPGKPTCAVYGTPLPGVPQGNAAAVRKVSKSKRRPERPFGGVLSSKAMREMIVKKARTK